MDANEQLFSEATSAVFDDVEPAVSGFDPEISSLMKEIPRLVSKMVSGQRTAYPENIRRTLPKVIGGVFDDASVGAAAFTYKGNYFIGLNWGTYSLLYELFRRLLSHPHVLPWVGDSSKEIPLSKFNDVPLRSEISDIRATFLSPQEVQYPRDPLREEAAWYLTHAATGWILFHEFRHIYGGHLDYNISRTGIPFIREMMSENKDSETGLILQAQEMDADLFASHYAIGNEVAWHRGDHPDNPHWHRFFPDPRHVIECALLRTDTVFKIFDMGDTPDPSTWAQKEHPPLFVRRRMNAELLWRDLPLINELSHLREVMTSQIMPTVFSISETTTSSLFGKPERDSPWATGQDVVHNHILAIFDAWRKILPEILPFRYLDSKFDRISRGE